MLSLEKAAWSFRVLPGDVVIFKVNSQTTNILNRLHAGLELRLPVASSTCRFRPFPIATGLLELIVEKGEKGWAGRGLVLGPAQRLFNVRDSARNTIPTLYTRGSSAMAQQAETVTARSAGRKFYIRLSLS